MSNVCNCPKPPGGYISCNANQLAICGYRDGEIVSGCFDKPDYAAHITDDRERNLVLSNWILSKITGIKRSDYDSIKPDLLAILLSGKYRNGRTGEVIKFSLPDDYDLQSVTQKTRSPALTK